MSSDVTKKLMKYFYVNMKHKDDVERHRNEETKLLKLIDEQKRESHIWSQCLINTYESCLQRLYKSKAELVSKIGKRK